MKIVLNKFSDTVKHAGIELEGIYELRERDADLFVL